MCTLCTFRCSKTRTYQIEMTGTVLGGLKARELHGPIRKMATTHTMTLGDPTLDSDHDELLRLSDRLKDVAGRDQQLSALDAVIAHAVRHFAVEDRELREMTHGNVQCHIDEHVNVLQSLNEVRALLTSGTDAAGNSRLLRELAAELLRWLPDHVHEMDAAVAAFRTKRRFGGSPVQVNRRRG